MYQPTPPRPQFCLHSRRSIRSAREAMSGYPPTRLRERPYLRHRGEKKKRAGSHVSNICAPLRESPTSHTFRFRPGILTSSRHSESMGSLAHLWRLQSGRTGMFCHMFCTVSGFVAQAAKVCDFVSLFTFLSPPLGYTPSSSTSLTM